MKSSAQATVRIAGELVVVVAFGTCERTFSGRQPLKCAVAKVSRVSDGEDVKRKIDADGIAMLEALLACAYVSEHSERLAEQMHGRESATWEGPDDAGPRGAA